MSFSAAIWICRLTDLEKWKEKFNSEITNQVVQSVRVAALRTGYLAGGSGFIYADNSLVFILPNLPAEQAQAVAEERGDKLQASIREFLHGAALAGVLAFFIRSRYPGFAGQNVTQELQALDPEIRTYAMPSQEEKIKTAEAQIFAEQKLREWK